MKLLHLTHHNIGIGLIFSLLIALIFSATSATAGTVSGRVTDGNAGLPAWVYVYNSADQYSDSWYAHTDENGDYAVTDLAAGEYKVRFDADRKYTNNINYISQWYNDTSDFNSADTVTVTASGTTANIDAVLAVGGGISGRVTDSDGSGIWCWVKSVDQALSE
jgi:hypothetical protein